MRKIEVPNWQEIKIAFFENEDLKNSGIDMGNANRSLYEAGYKDAIAYANTQLQTVSGVDWAGEGTESQSVTFLRKQERKRPFLSDDDIREGLNMPPSKSDDDFIYGAKWTRDRYEEMLSSGAETVEEWKPNLDTWVCGWNGPGGKAESVLFHASETEFGKYAGSYPGNLNRHLVTINGTNFAYDHVALIESLDEIGKPPSYFVQRGRCSISKNQKHGW